MNRLLSVLFDLFTVSMMFYFSNKIWGMDGQLFVLACTWFSSIQVERIVKKIKGERL